MWDIATRIFLRKPSHEGHRHEETGESLASNIRRLVIAKWFKLVGKDTGVLGYTQEFCSALHADHHGVCKFSSRLDQNYILVLGVLRRMVRQLDIASRFNCRRILRDTLSNKSTDSGTASTIVR